MKNVQRQSLCSKSFSSMSGLIAHLHRIYNPHFEQNQFEKNCADGLKKLNPTNDIMTLFNVPNPPPQFDILPLQFLNIQKYWL